MEDYIAFSRPTRRRPSCHGYHSTISGAGRGPRGPVTLAGCTSVLQVTVSNPQSRYHHASASPGAVENGRFCWRIHWQQLEIHHDFRYGRPTDSGSGSGWPAASDGTRAGPSWLYPPATGRAGSPAGLGGGRPRLSNLRYQNICWFRSSERPGESASAAAAASHWLGVTVPAGPGASDRAE